MSKSKPIPRQEHAQPLVESASAGSELPLFAQVQQSLRQSILEGTLGPGEKLPSESKLQTLFNVSRITVRQALSALQADGLVETFNGKGSFVTRPANAPKLGMLSGFFDHMRSKGREASGRILSVRTGKASAAVAHAIRVPIGTSVTGITTLRTLDGVPVCYGRVSLLPELAKRVLAHNLETIDVMQILEASLGFRLEQVLIEASAEQAGRERAKVLEVAPDAALLCVTFVPHDIEGRPLLFARMYFRSDKFSYKAVVRR